MSWKELDKYEYLTGDDLEYKPGVVALTKFEYSPLVNKESKKDEKERLLKRLKNFEEINKKQLEKQLKPIKNGIDNANANTRN